MEIAADRDVRKDLIIEAARLYYVEGLSQQEVGKRLNMVRSNVSKLLKSARERGIVEIRIVEPSTPMVQLEFGLKERFDLREVHVVMTERTYDKTLVSVGKQAAHYFEDQLSPGMRIAISSGTSLFQMVEHIQNLTTKGVSVVQLHGGIGAHNLEIDGWELARRLSRKLEAPMHIVHAPLIVRSRELRDLLVLDRNVAESIELAEHADIAFLGIGTPDPQYSALVRAGYITDEQSEELNRSGAEGMICGYFFDIDGTPIDSVLNRCVVSIDLEQLKTIPQRVAVAAGERKAIALLGAIRGGYVNGLVVDESAARHLLQASG